MTWFSLDGDLELEEDSKMNLTKLEEDSHLGLKDELGRSSPWKR